MITLLREFALADPQSTCFSAIPFGAQTSVAQNRNAGNKNDKITGHICHMAVLCYEFTTRGIVPRITSVF